MARDVLDGPGVLRAPARRLELTQGPPVLIDWAGRPLTPRDPFAPGDPSENIDKSDLARGSVRRSMPIMSVIGERWSIGAIRCALQAHAEGMFAESALLADSIMADDRVHATLGSRVASLFGQPVLHVPTPLATQESHDAWVSAWPKLAGDGALATIKRSTILMGFALAEIAWDTVNGDRGWWQPYLRFYHPSHLYFDWTQRCIMAMTLDGPVAVTPGDGRWFLHAPYGAILGWQQGAVRALAEQWFIKHLAWRDWARYNERHGLPMIKAYVPSGGNKEVKERFQAALSTLGQESVVMCVRGADGTSGYDVEMLEARDRAFDSFRSTIDNADRAIVLTVKWQNLTTEVDGGSFAAANVHGGVEQKGTQFDCDTLTFDIYQQISRPFASINFGDADMASKSTWDIAPPSDLKAEAEVLDTFARAVKSLRDAGVPFDLEALAKAYRVTLQSSAMAERLAQANVEGSPVGNNDNETPNDAVAT